MKDKLYTYKVTEVLQVHDGDTFKCIVDLGFRLYIKLVIRLLDFDAFEINHSKKLLSECKKYNVSEETGLEIGLRVRDQLQRILTNAKEIYLQTYTFDSFGRALAIVEADGLNVNKFLQEFQDKVIQESKK